MYGPCYCYINFSCQISGIQVNKAHVPSITRPDNMAYAAVNRGHKPCPLPSSPARGPHSLQWPWIWPCSLQLQHECVDIYSHTWGGWEWKGYKSICSKGQRASMGPTEKHGVKSYDPLFLLPSITGQATCCRNSQKKGSLEQVCETLHF